METTNGMQWLDQRIESQKTDRQTRLERRERITFTTVGEFPSFHLAAVEMEGRE